MCLDAFFLLPRRLDGKQMSSCNLPAEDLLVIHTLHCLLLPLLQLLLPSLA